MEYLAKSRTTETHRFPRPLREESSASQNRTSYPNNQALQALLRSGAIRAKLTLGYINDPAEHEAEQIATQVTNPIAANDAAATAINPNTIHRAPSDGHAVSNVPGLVERLLQSSGRPLDAASRAFFEPRFGEDFSDVRVHAGPEASASARSIQAHAYTAGTNIVFADGQYSPTSSSGRRLLAHELTHVVQQRAPRRSGDGHWASASRSIIQRSPAPQGELILPPEFFSDESPKERSKWRAIVDGAVRKQFGLSGDGITDAQVSYVSPKDFGKVFQGQSLEDALVTTFLDTDNVDAQNILRSNTKVAYLASDREWPSPIGMSFLREFIQEGIKKNSFEESAGGGLDIKTGQQMYPDSTITPAELLATEFAGVTTSSGPRSSRHINLRDETPGIGRAVYVQVFVHEALHFYGHDAYDAMIRSIKDPDNFIGGARISQILAEGVPEFFAEEVTYANRQDFGTLISSYPAETEQAAKLIAFLGEDTVRNAYFKGTAKDLQLIVSLVEASRNANFPIPIEAEKLFEPSHK